MMINKYEQSKSNSFSQGINPNNPKSNSFSQKITSSNLFKTNIWICLRIPKRSLMSTKQAACMKSLINKKNLKMAATLGA